MAYDTDLDDGVDDEERHDEEYVEGGVEEAEDTWPDDDVDKEADTFDPRYFDTERNPALDVKVQHDENFDDGLDEPEKPSEPFA